MLTMQNAGISKQLRRCSPCHSHGPLKVLPIKLRVKQHVFEECTKLLLPIAKVNLEDPPCRRWRRLEIRKRPRVDRSVREVRHAMTRQIEVQFPAHLARHFIGTGIERLPR